MLFLALATLVLAQAPAPTAARPAGVDPAALGPSVGLAIPRFEAKDQNGRARDFSSLAGPKGLVLVFFRSADW